MTGRTWVIEEQSKGLYAVLRNGRQLVCDYSLAAAERYVGRKHLGEDRVYIEPLGGQRRNISSKF